MQCKIPCKTVSRVKNVKKFIAIIIYIFMVSIGGDKIKEETLHIRLSKETQPFFFSAETCSPSPTFWGRTSFIKYSPVTHIPADHKSNNEVIQKKLMDWPISNQAPVSFTLKKKVRVIPKKRGGCKMVFRSKKRLASQNIQVGKAITISYSKRDQEQRKRWEV